MSISSFHAKEQRRFKAKIGVFLILEQDDQILMLRRHGTGIEDGLYVVPMGGVDESETPLAAVVREAREEVGIEVRPEDLQFVHLTYRKHTMPDGYVFYQQDLFFRATDFSGKIINGEPEKADDVRFFQKDALPANVSPFIAHALECVKKGIVYSEFGF